MIPSRQSLVLAPRSRSHIRDSSIGALLVDGLVKRYGDRVLWSGISFVLDAPGLTAITGPSGGGKTTLLNCIGGLEPSSGGSIWLRGVDVTRASDQARRRLYRKDVGFLFQSFGLVESWSVEANLKVALRYSGLPGGSWGRVMDEELSALGLRGKRREKVYRLSGGEQQRVALARLALKSPWLILADEPTSALDATNQDVVLRQLRAHVDRGAIVLVATHSDTVIRSCDSVLELSPV